MLKSIKPSLYTIIHSFLFTVISVVITLLISILTARLLGPEEKGKYDLIISAITLLSAILSFSLPSGIIYVISKQKSGILQLIKNLIIFCILQVLLVLIILLFEINTKNVFFTNILFPKISINYSLIIFISIYLFVVTLTSYFKAILIGYQKIIQANQYDFIKNILFPLFLLLGIPTLSLLGHQIYYISYLWIALFSLILGSLLYLYGLQSYIVSTLNHPSNLNKIIRFSAPCYLSNVLQLLNYRVDIFFVGYFSHNIAEVGFYVLAGNLVQLIWLLPKSMTTVIFSKIAHKSQQKDTLGTMIIAARIVFLISLIIGVLMALILPFILPIVYGNDFKPVISPIILLLPGVVIFTLANIFASYLAGIGEVKINLFSSAFGFIATIFMDILLIPKYGINGAAISSTVSYIASTLIIVGWITCQTDKTIFEILIPSYSDIKILLKTTINI